jgi:metallo-beta-lactamase family protein
MQSTLGFYGGVGSVTGANFVLDTGAAAFVIDCGLMQGDRFAQAQNAEPFPYDPRDIDVVLITHAHADHIGRLPKLVRDGFGGVIYSTMATKELSAIMLRDALAVMEYERERYGTVLLYEAGDIEAALAAWKTVEYSESLTLPDSVTAQFTNAGHILGSAMIRLVRGERTIVFTGDIGNVPQPLLSPPDVPKDYHYLVMESVYGDRSHEGVAERTDILRAHIEATEARGGTLIIPAFSLERTQAMLFEINNLVESGAIKPLPVFLDSPLAIEVTDLYRRFVRYLSPAVQAQIASGDDIFAFTGLSFTRTVKESSEIDAVKGAKVIIAGSGMSHGGRIRRHERQYLDDPRTTVLLVGYQAVGSVGRLLQDGAKKIDIDGEPIKVKARIERITGYSGHADRDQLVELVAQGGDQAKGVYVVMGEERASLFLTQRLRDYLGVPATAPTAGQEVVIEF